MIFPKYFTLTAASEPSSLKSSNFMTSAIMNPFSKSVWILPAAWGALVPFCGRHTEKKSNESSWFWAQTQIVETKSQSNVNEIGLERVQTLAGTLQLSFAFIEFKPTEIFMSPREFSLIWRFDGLQLTRTFSYDQGWIKVIWMLAKINDMNTYTLHILYELLPTSHSNGFIAVPFNVSLPERSPLGTHASDE